MRTFLALLLFFAACGGGGSTGGDLLIADIDSKEAEIQQCSEATDCKQFQCKVAQCKENKCVYQNKEDGLSCDDSDKCTVEESCKQGECVASKNICGGECEKDEDCLEKDDGDLCNGVPWCVEKKCIVKLESVVKCEKPKNMCVEVKCNPSDGKCVESKKDDNSPCSDGEECTDGDFCISGICEPGTNICECDSDSDCDKHESFCKGEYVCDMEVFPYVCKHIQGSEVVCSGNAPVCYENVCDEAQKGCVTKKSANNTPCDDNDPCTQKSYCLDGNCVADENSNLCECYEDKDCPDDGDLCNGTPYCDKGVFPYKCVYEDLLPVKCSVENDTECRKNLCNPLTGKCEMTPINEGGICNDANSCTENEKCSGGECMGNSIACNDDDKCTKDNCLADKGCVFTPIEPCCGNGKVEAGEECDPGKAITEGCTADCKYKKFQVNKYTNNAQHFPRVAYSFAHKTYFVVYQSAWQDNDGDGVFFNHVKPDGTVSTEAMLSKSGSGNQRIPDVDVSGSGSIIAAWLDGGDEIRANTIVESGGSFVASSGDEIVCSTGKSIPYGWGNWLSPRLLSVAALKLYDRALLLWSQDDGTYSQPDYNIWGCLLEIKENTLSLFKAPFMVNNSKAGEQKYLSASGGKLFLIAWYDKEEGGIKAVTMTKDGVLGDEVLLADMFVPHVTGSDTFAVTSSGLGLNYAKFDSEGKKTYGPIALFSDKLILYSSAAFTSPTLLTSAFMMLKSSSEIAVYLTQVSYPYQFSPVDESKYSQTSADIAASTDGHFLVVWESYEEDGSSFGIFGKMF